MRKRAWLIAMVMTAPILLAGCPGAGQYAGTWTVTIGANDYGLTLNANGTATAFMLDGTLTGTLTWETQGDVLTIHREVNGDMIRYIGQVVNYATSGGYIIWAGPGTGTGGNWSAVKQ